VDVTKTLLESVKLVAVASDGEVLLCGVGPKVEIVGAARRVLVLGVERAAATTEENVDDRAQRVTVANLMLGNGVEVASAVGVSRIHWRLGQSSDDRNMTM
jgi:hypothetical protein